MNVKIFYFVLGVILTVNKELLHVFFLYYFQELNERLVNPENNTTVHNKIDVWCGSKRATYPEKLTWCGFTTEVEVIFML